MSSRVHGSYFGLPDSEYMHTSSAYDQTTQATQHPILPSSHVELGRDPRIHDPPKRSGSTESAAGHSLHIPVCLNLAMHGLVFFLDGTTPRSLGALSDMATHLSICSPSHPPTRCVISDSDSASYIHLTSSTHQSVCIYCAHLCPS